VTGLRATEAGQTLERKYLEVFRAGLLWPLDQELAPRAVVWLHENGHESFPQVSAAAIARAVREASSKGGRQ